MREFALAFSILAALFSNAPVIAQSTEERRLDPARSTAQFSIQHVFVEHVTGTIPIVDGSLELSEGSVIPSRATAVLDASRMNTGDRDRDASLESPDYFDTKRFPTWTFSSTRIVATGPGAFSMDGMLTMHGVTQAEHLEVIVRGDAAHRIYHATGHIDRRTWGMKGTRLDPAIGNIADVVLDVVLN